MSHETFVLPSGSQRGPDGGGPCHHEVFLDLYFLRKIVRPGGLIVLDDDWTPSVRTAVRYYERNLGWTAIPGAFATGTHWTVGRDPAAAEVPRCRALRLPDRSFEPPFDSFTGL